MITINGDNITVEYKGEIRNNAVLKHIVEAYGTNSIVTKNAIVRAALDVLWTPDIVEVVKTSGDWMISTELTERLGDDEVVVIDAARISHKRHADNLSDFCAVVEAIYGSQDPINWIGSFGSCIKTDGSGVVIYIDEDVPKAARAFVMYHEYKHHLDGSATRVVLGHASVKSSKVEKNCDRYAVRRLLDQDDDLAAVEAAIDFNITSFFQWIEKHPDEPGDILYRAVLMYRYVRQVYQVDLETRYNMKYLTHKYLWK